MIVDEEKKKPEEDKVVRLFPNKQPDITTGPDASILNKNTKPNKYTKFVHAHQASSDLATVVLEHLALARFNISDPERIKDLALVMESISSYINKTYGIDHTLQVLAEEVFILKEDKNIYLKSQEIFEMLAKAKKDSDNT